VPGSKLALVLKSLTFVLVTTSTFGSVFDTSTGTSPSARSSHKPVAAIVDDVLQWSAGTVRANPLRTQDELDSTPPVIVDLPPPPALPEAAPQAWAAAAPAAARPVTAAPPLVIGSAQQSLINQDRASAGLPPLSWSGCLAGIAGGQAQAMAAAGTIFHGNGVQRDWSCGLNSAQTGENVGVWGAGINDAGINQLFMGSAGHRANILGPYHYVGTAWVVSGGKGYIAVEFA